MSRQNITVTWLLAWVAMMTSVACTRSIISIQKRQPKPITQTITKDLPPYKVANVPSGAKWYNIQCVEPAVCWLGDTLTRWQTIDGGKTWHLLYSATSEDQEIRGDTYIDAKVGWRVSIAGDLLKTEDGGRTWIQLPSTPMSNRKGELRVIHFLGDGNTGWIAGGLYRPLAKPELERGVPNNTYDPTTKSVLEIAIFHTTDGGRTWRRQSSPARPGRIYKIYFVDDSQGVALSDSGIFLTENAGNQWADVAFKSKCVAAPYRQAYDADPVDVSFYDSEVGWLSFDDGRMARSADGGRSWCDLVAPGTIGFALPFDKYFKKIHLTDPKHGWGLGGDEFIYETHDGGLSWQKFSESKFDDLYFPSVKLGLAVSKEGLYRIY